MVTARRGGIPAVAFVVGALGVTRTAVAEPNRPAEERRDYVRGIALGVRTGWGFPLGTRTNVGGVEESFGPGDNFSGLLPIAVDAGYRLLKWLYLGAYFEYGFLFVPGRNCAAPLTSCTAHDVRFGAGVHFHLLPHGAVDPWLGIGSGYEASTLTLSNDEQTTKRTNAGIEFANLLVGADVHSAFGLNYGPFLSFSVDQYTTETQTPPAGESKTYHLDRPRFHFFLVLGARAQFDL